MITKELKKIIYNYTEIDLTDEKVLMCRDRDFIEARAMYYSLLRQFTNMTYTKIGQTVGKNHATVLHASEALPFWLKQDEGLNNVYTKIEKDFRNFLGYDEADRKLDYNIERLMHNYLDLKKNYEALKEKYSKRNEVEVN